MRTIRLKIAFDGTGYHGWQFQPTTRTIQGEIEKHLAVMHNGRITLHGAGRTDAGVHATGMVAHFRTETSISCDAFLNGLNSMLDEAIRILSAEEATADFHARFSAKGKTYSYSICNSKIMLPQQRLYSLHVKPQLDLTAMQHALDLLVGTHDFACFETAGSRDPLAPCERGSTRTITSSVIRDNGDGFYTILVTGDGFLRHMVRNIVGTAIEIGLGRRTLESINHALAAKKRSAAGATAPAHGLTLIKIYY